MIIGECLKKNKKQYEETLFEGYTMFLQQKWDKPDENY